MKKKYSTNIGGCHLKLFLAVDVSRHGSEKPGEAEKPGDMINNLKSQGELGKVGEKISKILQVMEESGRFF